MTIEASSTGAGPVARNVVLVHGAYADGSSWSEVIRILQAAGLNVSAVQNPLISLADDVAATERSLDRLTGPTVLAGHSWAGTVISEVGDRPDVSALVYVAARAPEAGEDYEALAATFPSPPASAGLEHAGGFAQLGEETFLDSFAEGVEPPQARVLYAVQGPVADPVFASRTTRAAWKNKPCWYAVSTRDQATHPALQRFLAERMNAATIEVDAGHMSLITHPEHIAAVILSAAGASRTTAALND